MTKSSTLSTKYFNFALFIEGIKRLRVVGAAVAILSVVLSALVPAVYWMEAGEVVQNVALIAQNGLCYSLYIVAFLAPTFARVLFSYLHKRKESDFFHAIPYTRTCVYVSFASAALCLLFVIQILSALVAGILWAVNPHTTFVVGELISVTLISMLCAALLFALMTFAIVLSGTSLTTFLLFVVMCLFVRLVMSYLSGALGSNLDLIDVSDWHYLNFDWFMPYALFAFAIGGYIYGYYTPLWDPACIVYTLLVTLGALALGWLCYKRRKSEMAGNAAPSRLAQHIYRCLFTLPIALLFPLCMFTNNDDASLLMVIVVVTLLAYFLYELITTKRMKNLGTAAPWLIVLVIGAVAFSLTYQGIFSYVLNTPIHAEDVASVSVEFNTDKYDTYQRYLLYDKGTSNADVIKTVCDAYAKTQKADLHNNYKYLYTDDDPKDSGLIWRDVKFTLKSGRVVKREMCMPVKSEEKFNKAYINALEMTEEIYDIPQSPYKIISIEGQYYLNSQDGIPKGETYTVVDIDELQKVYQQIYQDYMALTYEQKQAIRNRNYIEENRVNAGMSYFQMNIRITTSPSNNQSLKILIYIDKDTMPNAYEALVEYKSESWYEDKPVY